MRKKTQKQSKPAPAQIIQNDIGEFIRNSGLASRAMISSRLGRQFGGDRNLYENFGYIQDPAYDDYRALYDRQGLACRAVEIFSDDTWRKAPVLIDGEGRSDDLGEQKTAFLTAWNDLVDRLGVWQMMRQTDVMCGIGRYSILFLGAPGADFSQPAGNDGLFYLAAYDEQQASIGSWITDQKSEKYGMPQTYNVMFAAPGEMVPVQGGSSVHFSRIIHVSENRLGSRVYGRPRLQTAINRLFDLEKVTGGSAEAVWLSMYKGLVLSAREGTELPTPGSDEEKGMEEQLWAYVHQLTRIIRVKNTDVNSLGTDEIRVRDTYDIQISDLAGTLGVPQRILLGSERGELASSQDMRAWNGVIETRRTNFADPELLRPFINWCIAHKVLPKPTSKKVDVEWKPVYTMTEIERADVALKTAQGANTVTGGVPENAIDVNEWRGMVGLPPREVVEIPDEDPDTPDTTGTPDAEVTSPDTSGENMTEPVSKDGSGNA